MSIDIDDIRKDIQNNNLRIALSHIIAIIDSNGLAYRNEAIIHSARLQQLHSDQRKGLLGLDDARMETTRIISALLELLEDIEQELKRKNIPLTNIHIASQMENSKVTRPGDAEIEKAGNE